MILNALVDYYDRLAADPESDVATFGYSVEKVSYCIVLKADGTLASIQDIREEVETGGKAKKKQKVPRRLVVPDTGGRSGTLIQPNFLWDNTGYVLGADSKGKPTRSKETFDAFREFTREFLDRVNDKGLKAVVAFLDEWKPSDAKKLEDWEDICDSNVVFRLSNRTEYVHESDAIKKAWSEYLAGQEKTESGFSLISGDNEPLARLHPMIRGVIGAQTSGAAIVSFNQDSFESFEKSQSYNAPVGVNDTFRYTTALNRLVGDSRRRVRLGDMTVVYWSGKPTEFEAQFAAFADSRAARVEDEDSLTRQRSFLDNLRRAYTDHNPLADAKVPFYILGISPNASRLSIRFWLTGTVQEFAERIGRHITDLSIVGSEDMPPLTIDRVVLETARPKGGWADADSVSPLLAGAVWRSIFEGIDYPQALLHQIIGRIRAEGFASAENRKDWRDAICRRTAILKAFLIRNYKQEISVALNESGAPPYQLGRLFAVLEKVQEEANEYKLNATIKDRYFASASAAPVTAFPVILRLHAHHLEKLKNIGRKVNLERLVQEICANIDGFPRQLRIDQQGQFFIGYYHQRQALFTKKAAEGEAASTETTTTQNND